MLYGKGARRIGRCIWQNTGALREVENGWGAQINSCWSDIKHEVHNSGVDHDDLTRLFDIIFEDSAQLHFSALQKRPAEIRHCAYSQQIALDLLLDRILSNISEPKMYYVNGTDQKSNRHQKYPNRTLDWLLCSTSLVRSQDSYCSTEDFLFSSICCRTDILLSTYLSWIFLGVDEIRYVSWNNNRSAHSQKWHIKLVLGFTS